MTYLIIGTIITLSLINIVSVIGYIGHFKIMYKAYKNCKGRGVRTPLHIRESQLVYEPVSIEEAIELEMVDTVTFGLGLAAFTLIVIGINGYLIYIL